MSNCSLAAAELVRTQIATVELIAAEVKEKNKVLTGKRDQARGEANQLKKEVAELKSLT